MMGYPNPEYILIEFAGDDLPKSQPLAYQLLLEFIQQDSVPNHNPQYPSLQQFLIEFAGDDLPKSQPLAYQLLLEFKLQTPIPSYDQQYPSLQQFLIEFAGDDLPKSQPLAYQLLLEFIQQDSIPNYNPQYPSLQQFLIEFAGDDLPKNQPLAYQLLLEFIQQDSVPNHNPQYPSLQQFLIELSADAFTGLPLSGDPINLFPCLDQTIFELAGECLPGYPLSGDPIHYEFPVVVSSNLKKLGLWQQEIASAHLRHIVDKSEQISADLKKTNQQEEQISVNLKKTNQQEEQVSADLKNLDIKQLNQSSSNLRKINKQEDQISADLKRTNKQEKQISANLKKENKKEGQISSNLKKINKQEDRISANLKKLKFYYISESADLLKKQSLQFVSDSFLARPPSWVKISSNLKKQTNAHFSSSSSLVESYLSEYNISSHLAYHASLIKSYEQVYSEGNILEQGKASGSANPNENILFVWIKEGEIIGRVDTANAESVIAQKTIIHGRPNIESVKVCYVPIKNKWILVWKESSNILYATLDEELNAHYGIITQHATTSVITDHFDIGADNNGNLLVLYASKYGYGELAKLDISLNVSHILIYRYSSHSSNRMYVHKNTGDISILYVNGTNLYVDEYYDYSINYKTVLIATGQIGLDSKHADILEAPNGWVACWSSDAPGSNIHYRIYKNGSFTTDIATVNNKHINNIGKAFFADVGFSGDNHYSFLIKTVDASMSPECCTFVYVQVHHGIVERSLIYTPVNRMSPTPLTAVNSYEYAHIYNDGPNINFEIYVNSSIYMGFWRLDHNSSIFVNNADMESFNIIRAIYENYPGGRLSGATGSSNEEYNSYRSTNILSDTTFEEFLTNADEDTVLIGGPMVSEIVFSMQNNDYWKQILSLKVDIEISDVRFIQTTNTNGFSFGTEAPAIRITNNHGTFTLNRHIEGTNVVDYAIIMRLSITLESTQQTKSLIYLAGINKIGTEAAAYCLAHPVLYDLGESLSCLVILRYPTSFNPYTENYTPGSTGTIETVPLSEIS